MSPFTMYQEAMSAVHMRSCSQCTCCLQSVWVCVERKDCQLYYIYTCKELYCYWLSKPHHNWCSGQDMFGQTGHPTVDSAMALWRCVHGTIYNQSIPPQVTPVSFCPQLHAILSHHWAAGLYAHWYHVGHYPISHPVPVWVCHPTPPGSRVSIPPSPGAIVTQARRQKELYNKKVHGRPFECGDVVWLHSPVTPCGQSRELSCPWMGPYCIIRWISDATYRIQNVHSSRHHFVVYIYTHPVITLWFTLIASSCVFLTCTSPQNPAQPLSPLWPQATILSNPLAHVWKSLSRLTLLHHATPGGTGALQTTIYDPGITH